MILHMWPKGNFKSKLGTRLWGNSSRHDNMEHLDREKYDNIPRGWNISFKSRKRSQEILVKPLLLKSEQKKTLREPQRIGTKSSSSKLKSLILMSLTYYTLRMKLIRWNGSLLILPFSNGILTVSHKVIQAKWELHELSKIIQASQWNIMIKILVNRPTIL